MRFKYALIALSMMIFGGSGHALAETWISTWAAPAFARTDQPAQTLSATAQAFPWSRDVPPAAVGQELAVGGASPLHFKNQTLRQITHISAGGDKVRVVLANSLGTLPLRVGAASVAIYNKGSAIVAGSSRPLTFGGLVSPLIPAGAILASDPVDLKVANFTDLVVDMYLPEDSSVWEITNNDACSIMAGEFCIAGR